MPMRVARTTNMAARYCRIGSLLRGGAEVLGILGGRSHESPVQDRVGKKTSVACFATDVIYSKDKNVYNFNN